MARAFALAALAAALVLPMAGTARSRPFDPFHPGPGRTTIATTVDGEDVVFTDLGADAHAGTNHRYLGVNGAATPQYHLRDRTTNASNWHQSARDSWNAWDAAMYAAGFAQYHQDYTNADGTGCVEFSQIASNKVVLCSANDGDNGYVGLTSYSVDGNGHIDKALTRLNDYYFSGQGSGALGRYEITCHELGHTLGLIDNGGPGESCIYGEPLSSEPGEHDIEALAEMYHSH